MPLLFRYILVIAAAVYLHHAVLPLLLTADFTPDLTLITIVYLGVVLGGLPAIVVGFGLGLVSDLFGWGPVGVSAFVGTAAGYACGGIRSQVYDYSLLVPAVMAALAVILKGIVSFLILTAFAGTLSFGWHVVGKLAIYAAATGLAAVPLIFLFWRIIPPPGRPRRRY